MERTLFEDEHELFRDSVRAFIAKELAPHHEAWEQAGIVDRDLFTKAGAQGFLGMAVPEAYGGGGVEDFRYNVVIAEEVQKAGVNAAGLGWTLHNDICLPYFLTLTTDEQKARWLPGICSGELITAIAMTEPGIGSDLASMTTTAVRDGDHYVVNGSKTFITNGINADLVITAVKTDPTQRHAGMSLLVLERGMPGFERGPQPREDRDARAGHGRAVLHRRGGAASPTGSATRAAASVRWSRSSPRSGCRSRSPAWRRPVRPSTSRSST